MSIDDDNEGPMIGLPDPDSDPAHARVRAALGQTGAALAPPPGWEQKVWARIDADEAAPPSRADAPGASRRGWWLGGAALAAAAVILLVLHPWRTEPTSPPATGGEVASIEMPAASITFRQGAQVMRGTTAAPGETMVIRHDQPSVRVWIYVDDTLLSSGGAAHEVVLERPGTYHVLSVASDRAAPATLDAALASLLRDGTSHRRTAIDVR